MDPDSSVSERLDSWKNAWGKFGSEDLWFPGFSWHTLKINPELKCIMGASIITYAIFGAPFKVMV